MKYGPKWIEENLGIKRSTLRVYERKGLLPHRRETWREYTKEEVEYIWMLKVLTGVGFSHKELREAIEGGELDIRKGLTERLSVLEAQRNEIERNIRYLKEIKQAGRIPTWPKRGLEKYDDFQESAKRAIVSDDADSAAEELAAVLMELLVGEPKENAFLEFMRTIMSGDLGFLESEEDLKASIAMNALLQIIASKRSLDPHDPYVQALVRALYEAEEELAAAQGHELTLPIFARHNMASLTSFGDSAVISRARLSEEGCEYAAKAIAIFAGYEELDDVNAEGGLDLPNE
ncbi:MerR family transcriptional regulator [Olsenella sp. SW781]|uniref:MerR family transcriptional regulator n=1 Tax=Olsenella sp. SW781 TaxID=2530046 RepID=UPI00143CB14A|nr:MerR family transcriptional regulator [Olsenella sp. SW781]NJE81780.1 MerR family transcriptional regulator [Olsenella sp. SW781]